MGDQGSWLWFLATTVQISSGSCESCLPVALRGGAPHGRLHGKRAGPAAASKARQFQATGPSEWASLLPPAHWPCPLAVSTDWPWPCPAQHWPPSTGPLHEGGALLAAAPPSRAICELGWAGLHSLSLQLPVAASHTPTLSHSLATQQQRISVVTPRLVARQARLEGGEGVRERGRVARRSDGGAGLPHIPSTFHSRLPAASSRSDARHIGFPPSKLPGTVRALGLCIARNV